MVGGVAGQGQPRTAAGSQRASSGSSGGGGAAAAEALAIVAEPPEVVFTSYEPGGVHTATLRLRNAGRAACGLRLLPPASQYFHASLPRWVAPQRPAAHCCPAGFALRLRRTRRPPF